MRLTGIFLLIVLFIGCKKEKRKAPDAFFIKPESISVAVTNSTLQGTTSHKITDLWYYVDNQFKGAFPIGNILPIPSIDNANILVFPGIKNNGISETRQPYEFYEPYGFDTSVAAGTTVKRNFTFKYKSNTKFNWLEDFEGFGTTTGISIKNSNGTDTSFIILNKLTTPGADVFEGNKCLHFALDGVKQIAQFESTSQFPLPKSGAPVYLEINYKCTQPFDVGVYSGSSYMYVSTVNTSEGWNKIYIQLSTAVSTLSGTNCGLYFRAFRDLSIQQSFFWIDNIKIISYQ